MTRIYKEDYGQLDDGTLVERYTLRSDSISVSVITYGARIESIRAPDRSGLVQDIVLGFDSLQGFVNNNEYTGAIVGRFANRIAQGRFTLDNRVYNLPVNAPPNTLHGGKCGFDRKVWRAHTEATSLLLTYQSADGEEGFPGQLNATVGYSLEDDRLRIAYTATTDQATVIIEITIFADRFTPIDATMIPTGESRDVEGTPFDFTKGAAVGARIHDRDEQLRLAGGYDHNWILPPRASRALMHAATAYEPKSGRTVRVLTSQPGIQFYSGNNLTGRERGRMGIVHAYRCGLCLETQHYPDSPNQPRFPSTELRAGQEFRSATVFQFGTRPSG